MGFGEGRSQFLTFQRGMNADKGGGVRKTGKFGGRHISIVTILEGGEFV